MPTCSIMVPESRLIEIGEDSLVRDVVGAVGLKCNFFKQDVDAWQLGSEAGNYFRRNPVGDKDGKREYVVELLNFGQNDVNMIVRSFAMTRGLMSYQELGFAPINAIS